jgi:hypothetical protein
MNLFNVAELQLQKEVRSKLRKSYKLVDVIDYAIKIRHYLDIQERNKAISEARLKCFRQA